MDAMWMFECKVVAIALVPFVLASGWSMFWTHKRNASDTLVNIATNSWIIMNVSWMLSDFYKHAPLLPQMKMIFFSIGLVAVLILACTDYQYLKKFKRFK